MDDKMNAHFSDSLFVESVLALIGADCPKEQDGDYRDDDGLLVCGVCGEHKESRHDFRKFGVRTHPCMCKCGAEEYNRQQEDMKIRNEQSAVDKLFRYSLIDERFKESTFDKCVVNQDNEKVVRIAKNYVERFDDMYAHSKGLLLWGQTGTGKTFIASCIANELLKKRVPLIVTSIIKLTSATGPFSHAAEEQSELIACMNRAKLLVIDDLGAERGTDYKMEQVFEVINTRYGAKRPMIVTTNLSLQQMQDETDIRKRRVYERVLEMCYPVKFVGKSWRMKTAEDDFDVIKDILLK